ncbi:hypothetical protein OK023_14585 [Serratia sp. UGAL515B_01]|nr:hypothetical protein OK023_14585 [Serratia sp. UGAL515B_01]
MYGDTLAATVDALAANILLRPIANIINKQPFSDVNSECIYQRCVIAFEYEQCDVLDKFKGML